MAIHIKSRPLHLAGRAAADSTFCQAGPIQPRRDSAIKIGFDPGKRAASAQITVCYELLRSLLPLNWPDAGLSWPGGGETPEYRAGPPCRRAPCWKAKTHRGTARATSPRPTADACVDVLGCIAAERWRGRGRRRQVIAEPGLRTARLLAVGFRLRRLERARLRASGRRFTVEPAPTRPPGTGHSLEERGPAGRRSIVCVRAAGRGGPGARSAGRPSSQAS